MTYNGPEMIVLGDAAQLIQGTKSRGFDGCGVIGRIDFAEENED